MRDYSMESGDEGLRRYGFWVAVILLTAFLVEVAFTRRSATSRRIQ